MRETCTCGAVLEGPVEFVAGRSLPHAEEHAGLHAVSRAYIDGPTS